MSAIAELTADINARLAQIIEQRRELREQIDAEHDRANRAAREWEDRVAAAVQDAKKLPAPPPDADVRTLGAAADALDREEVALKVERDQRIRDNAAQLETAIAENWHDLAAALAEPVAAIEAAVATVCEQLSDLRRLRTLTQPAGVAHEKRADTRTVAPRDVDVASLAAWVHTGADPTRLQPVAVLPGKFLAPDDGEGEPPTLPAPQHVPRPAPLGGGARL